MEQKIKIYVKESTIKRNAALMIAELEQPIFCGETVEYIEKECEYLKGAVDMLCALGVIDYDGGEDMQDIIKKKYHERKDYIIKKYGY